MRRSKYTSRSYKAASHPFKSGDLNNLHLDRAALDLVFHPEETETNVASSPKNGVVKHRMKKEKKDHHNGGHNTNHGQHKHNRSQCAHESSAVTMHDDGVDNSALITTQAAPMAGTKLSGSTHVRKKAKVIRPFTQQFRLQMLIHSVEEAGCPIDTARSTHANTKGSGWPGLP